MIRIKYITMIDRKKADDGGGDKDLEFSSSPYHWELRAVYEAKIEGMEFISKKRNIEKQKLKLSLNILESQGPFALLKHLKAGLSPDDEYQRLLFEYELLKKMDSEKDADMKSGDWALEQEIKKWAEKRLSGKQPPKKDEGK